LELRVTRDSRAQLVQLDLRDQLDFVEKVVLQVALDLLDLLDSLDPVVLLEQQGQLELKVSEDRMVQLDHRELEVTLEVQVHQATLEVLGLLVISVTQELLVRQEIKV
jgi:hypothetical protein